ncbi:MAG: 1-acyl-sn-glycerol-3-phosphate acyltransferase [Actinomycetota bacterium]|nr:1-acyl-sn-glycerol-3-phosphate acyltransferase [Actinomycetota bacterium]
MAEPSASGAEVIKIEEARSPGRCQARTSDGKRCRNRADTTGYCTTHHPAEPSEPTALEMVLQDVLAFMRRRATGDYHVDDFGFDKDLTESVLLPALRPLFKNYWRIDQTGVSSIPETGPALFVCNHSGTLPLDALMVKVGVFEERRRHIRLLAADLALSLPIVGELARKGGSTLACEEDAMRLLDGGEAVAVFPEGFKGIGKPFRERYRLQRFGRGGFVEVALRAQVPIIPVAIVGAEEIFPMIANLKPLARLFGFPYFPVTPTFPFLGPLGMIPLPSKWVIEYGEPISTADFGSDGSIDPMLVFNLTDQVRDTIQQMLYRNLIGRRNAFF